MTSYGWPRSWWVWLHVSCSIQFGACVRTRGMLRGVSDFNTRFRFTRVNWLVRRFCPSFSPGVRHWSLSCEQPTGALTAGLTYRWIRELWQLKRTCTPKWPRGGSASPDWAPSNMGPLWTCCCPWASRKPGREYTHSHLNGQHHKWGPWLLATSLIILSQSSSRDTWTSEALRYLKSKQTNK